MRYVILFHEMPPGSDRASHFDFMLEEDDHLATWCLRHVPDVVVRQPCRRLAVHRLAYLDYEGPVASAGGSVSQWDSGEYEALDAGDELWRVKLTGKRLVGVAKLQQLAGQRWTFDFALAAG